jgi:hypothetical protein
MLVFASLSAIDGICCPDGCTHEQEASSHQPDQHSGDGSCLLCLGGIGSAAASTLSPSCFVTNRIGLPSLSSHLDALATPPDHPPRS